MTKQAMIAAIRSRNHTAREEFLVLFDERALQRYLDRLERCAGHRGRQSRWVRETLAAQVTQPGQAEPTAQAGVPELATAGPVARVAA